MQDSIKTPRYSIVFVLGPPGCGKGTLCKAALDQSKHHFVHLSVGDYLRTLCEPETPCGAANLDRDKIRAYLKENKLLPADMLIPLLKDKMESVQNQNNNNIVWLIDGFPRDTDTAHVFEEKIGRPDTVIVLECPQAVVKDRFLSRAREKADDEKRFEKRYAEYVNNMKVIREHYANITEIVHVDKVREECRSAFLTVLSKIRGGCQEGGGS